jgi:hypothetical protein
VSLQTQSDDSNLAPHDWICLEPLPKFPAEKLSQEIIQINEGRQAALLIYRQPRLLMVVEEVITILPPAFDVRENFIQPFVAGVELAHLFGYRLETLIEIPIPDRPFYWCPLRHRILKVALDGQLT